MDKEEWKGRDTGSLGAVAYPTGSVLSYTPDGVSRPVSAVDTAHGITYANNAAYWAHGALNTLTLGSGITRTDSYSNRLQPTTLVVAASGGQRMNLSYNFNTGGGNNGNVMQIANVLNSDRTQNFTYDALNRIYQAKTQATTGQYCWGQNFTIDNWGNLYSITAPSTHAPCTVPQLNLSATATNQLNGLGYDAAGNTISDGVGGTYTYDGENRQTSVTPGNVTYTYDGDGKRVKKSNGKLYWYGVSGEVLTETDLAGNTPSEYVFFGGQRVARRDPSGNVYYYFGDHLGSSRVILDASGNTCYDADFYPYGGERNYLNTCPQNYKFTGKERDTESGLDYFGARYDASNLGRFMTPDPLMASGHARNPQTWNRYAYTLNNPLRFVDPNGMEVPEACARDPKNCTIVVKINVIYDKTANKGKGLTAEQKQKFEKEQIEKAKKDFGKSNIQLDVTYSAGSFTVGSDGKAHVTGTRSDALNVVLSDATMSGQNETGVDKATGLPIAFINVNDMHSANAFPAFANSTEHELVHNFKGDVYKSWNPFFYAINEYVVDFQLTTQGVGASQQSFRTGLEPRRYAAPLNPEANKPQQ